MLADRRKRIEIFRSNFPRDVTVSLHEDVTGTYSVSVYEFGKKGVVIVFEISHQKDRSVILTVDTCRRHVTIRIKQHFHVNNVVLYALPAQL